MRLKDTKTLGFISPDEFIPISEHDGTILELGRIVFEKVCKLYSTVNFEKLGMEYIEVNLSGVQCMSTDLYSQLKKIMIDYNVNPSFINLEITETSAINSTDILEKNMNMLGALGCTFSLDDFGTGYSNLTQILNLPLTIIKLDKSLVWSYFDEENPKSSILAFNIINMIQQLKLHIVAEGVETLEQAQALGEMHVEYLQGYYFSKPIPEKDFVIFLQNAVDNPVII